MNQKGLELLKSFERCELEAYQDVRGVWTIGWGCTTNVTPGLVITQENADLRLVMGLKETETRVANLVKVPLNENQRAALECLVYNIGSGNFSNSTLLKYLNSGCYQEAADEFLVWDKSGGKAFDGLLRRRNAERDLFLSPV